MNSSNCLTDHQLQDLLQADADDRDEDVEELRHLEVCPRCRDRLESMAAGTDSILADFREAHRSEQVTRPDRLIRKLLTQRDMSPVGFEELDDWWQDLLTPTTDPNVLGCLGGFDVLGTLGRGGMGLVLRGFDPQLRRPVAIKIPAKDLAASPDYRRQFLHEAQAAASLSHENVVSIYQVGEEQDCPYLVMELVNGGTLADRVRRGEPFSNEELYHLGRETAQGLASAHQTGLIHGDLKPANILWDQETNRYKLADFGLARHIAQPQRKILAGTPAYMAPEQARGEPADERSDLYSLGLILRDCATGFIPQVETSSEWTVEQLSRTDQPALRQAAPHVERRLADIIEALLRSDPEQRIPTAEALQARLSPRAIFSRRAMWSVITTSLLSVSTFALAAEAMGWIDLIDSIGPTPITAVEYPIQVEGIEGGFTDLASAIERAGDGDRILVIEEGPHSIPPIEIKGKSLEIVGAPGIRPVFVPQDVAHDQPAPLLTTNANLTLSSLEFRFQVAAPRQLDERWDRTAVRVRSSLITLDKCRFLVGRSNVGVTVDQGQVACDQCEFLGDGAVGIHWLTGSTEPSRISRSHFATTIGLAVEYNSDEGIVYDPALTLRRSVFRSERAIQLVFDAFAGSSRPVSLDLTTSENLFDADHVICVFPRSRRRVQELESWQALRMLRRILQWKGESNLYRKGGSLASTVAMRFRPQPIWEASESAERWRDVWGVTESGSRLASFQFKGPAVSTTSSDHRLRTVLMDEGETPAWALSLIETQP